MPEPITSPTTIATTENSPSTWSSWWSSAPADRTGGGCGAMRASIAARRRRGQPIAQANGMRLLRCAGRSGRRLYWNATSSAHPRPSRRRWKILTIFVRDRSDLPKQATEPHAPPIYLSSVYECRDPEQADALLSGREHGLRLCPRRPSQRRSAGRKVPPTARHRAGRDHQLGHGGAGAGRALAARAGRPRRREQSALWPHAGAVDAARRPAGASPARVVDTCDLDAVRAAL